MTFFHRVLVDIPPTARMLEESAEPDGRVAQGRPATPTKVGVHGVNDFTKSFAGNDRMKGQ